MNVVKKDWSNPDVDWTMCGPVETGRTSSGSEVAS